MSVLIVAGWLGSQIQGKIVLGCVLVAHRKIIVKGASIEWLVVFERCWVTSTGNFPKHARYISTRKSAGTNNSICDPICEKVPQRRNWNAFQRFFNSSVEIQFIDNGSQRILDCLSTLIYTATFYINVFAKCSPHSHTVFHLNQEPYCKCRTLLFNQHSNKLGGKDGSFMSWLNLFLCVLFSQEKIISKEVEIKRKLQELKQNLDALSVLEEE